MERFINKTDFRNGKGEKLIFTKEIRENWAAQICARKSVNI
jgi:hypothetical protein